ncbi:MAG: hypothetical protein ACPGVT_13305 [Maricaulaceae bacterium]
MTHKLMKTVLVTGCAAMMAFGASAMENGTKTANADSTMTANSTAELKKKYDGKHIDSLPEVEESTKAVDNPDRVVCKKITKLGSRLKKRKVCATKKEWDRMKDNSVNSMRSMQLRRQGGDG